MTKAQLVKFLEAKGACEEGLNWLEGQENLEVALTEAPVDYLVWLICVIGGPAYAEYKLVTGPAYAEYERAEGLALAEYMRIEGPAYAEHKRAEGLAYAEYKRVEGPAYAEYERAEGLALAEYKRVEGLAVRSALTYERIVAAVEG